MGTMVVFAGAVISVAALFLLNRPLRARSVAPSMTINHFRFAGESTTVKCAGVDMHTSDIEVAAMDGVGVVPRARAVEVLAKAQTFDNTQHSLFRFIQSCRSIREAFNRFGRL